MHVHYFHRNGRHGNVETSDAGSCDRKSKAAWKDVERTDKLETHFGRFGWNFTGGGMGGVHGGVHGWSTRGGMGGVHWWSTWGNTWGEHMGGVHGWSTRGAWVEYMGGVHGGSTWVEYMGGQNDANIITIVMAILKSQESNCTRESRRAF